MSQCAPVCEGVSTVLLLQVSHTFGDHKEKILLTVLDFTHHLRLRGSRLQELRIELTEEQLLVR